MGKFFFNTIPFIHLIVFNSVSLQSNKIELIKQLLNCRFFQNMRKLKYDINLNTSIGKYICKDEKMINGKY